MTRWSTGSTCVTLMLQVRSAVEETPAATLAAVLIPNLIRSQVLHAFTFIVVLIIPKVL